VTNPFALDQPSAPAPAAPAAPAPAPAVTAPAQPAVDPQYQAWLASQAAQQQAPAATPAAAVPAAAPAQADPFGASGADPFDNPAPQQPRGPRLRDMYGRLLLVIPHKVETVPNRLQPGTTQDRMTADVVILDGPCPYGGRPEATPPVPHDKLADVPHKTPRMYISGVGIISQCREALAKRQAGGMGMVLGRLMVGEAKEQGQNAPYLLSVPTEAEKQVARNYLLTVDPFA